jgi:hypothetical protein
MLLNAVLWDFFFIFIIFKLKSLEMSLGMIHFSISFFMIIIINFAIVGSLSLLLGVNAFKIWDKFTEDKSLDDLRDDILGIIYYSLTIITEISLIILLNFLVYLLLSGDLKSTMSLTGFIFLIDIFLFLLMSLFFRLQENKRRQINIRNPSYVIAE